MSKKTGTHEWSDETYNIQSGCQNNCKYCYAKSLAIWGKREKSSSWEIEKPNLKQINKNFKQKKTGVVMYPSSHDITPTNLTNSILAIRNLINCYSKVLIVSKARLNCIPAICKQFNNQKDKIEIRITIGSSNSSVLKFWEPNAPSFKERLECLKFAYNNGYETSVSCEPMLDDNVDDVIQKVQKYVTGTIWVGKANKLLQRLSLNGYKNQQTIDMAKQLMAWQSDDEILALYEKHKNNPKIRWKDSIIYVLAKHGIKI